MDKKSVASNQCSSAAVAVDKLSAKYKVKI